jgi:hypothetical protein
MERLPVRTAWFLKEGDTCTIVLPIPPRPAQATREACVSNKETLKKHLLSLGIDLGTPGYSYVIAVVRDVPRDRISTVRERLLRLGPLPVGDALLQGLSLDQLIDRALVKVVEHGSLEVRIAPSAWLARFVLNDPRRPVVTSLGGRDRREGSVFREGSELVVSEERTLESLDHSLTRLRFDQHTHRPSDRGNKPLRSAPRPPSCP